MAYYNYKRVIYRDDYKEAKLELEALENVVYEDEVDYDGDAWIVIEYLLNKLQKKISQLRDSEFPT